MSGSNLSGAYSPRTAGLGPEQGAEQPLGLTVHSLPHAGDAMAAMQRTRGKGRWQMLALLLVCAAPVIASYFTYYVIRPEGRRSYGELIDPQRPMPAQARVHALDGTPLRLDALRGRWLLVSVAGGACDADCRNNLYLQRQLRESMGREKERVDWVWLVSDDAEPPPTSRRRSPRPRCCAQTAPRWMPGSRPRPAMRWPSTCTWWTPWATG